MQKRLGMLLILIPALASAAFVVADSVDHARPAPAPKTLEAPKPKPAGRDDAQSQAPQHSPGEGEVIGVPMFA
jgi:hypothetical protein